MKPKNPDAPLPLGHPRLLLAVMLLVWSVPTPLFLPSPHSDQLKTVHFPFFFFSFMAFDLLPPDCLFFVVFFGLSVLRTPHLPPETPRFGALFLPPGPQHGDKETPLSLPFSCLPSTVLLFFFLSKFFFFTHMYFFYGLPVRFFDWDSRWRGGPVLASRCQGQWQKQ